MKDFLDSFARTVFVGFAVAFFGPSGIIVGVG
jgi:hypothetical protein